MQTIRVYDADVALVFNGSTKCENCHTERGDVQVQLPHPGDKPSTKTLCKSCIADIVEFHFNR